MFSNQGNANPFGTFSEESASHQTRWPIQAQNNGFGPEPSGQNSGFPSSGFNVNSTAQFAQQSQQLQPQGDMVVDNDATPQQSNPPKPFANASTWFGFPPAQAFVQPVANGFPQPPSNSNQFQQTSFFFDTPPQPQGADFQPRSNPFVSSAAQPPQTNNVCGNNQAQFPVSNGVPAQQTFSQGTFVSNVPSNGQGIFPSTSPLKASRKAIGAMSSSAVAQMLNNPLPSDALTEVRSACEPQYNPVTSFCPSTLCKSHEQEVYSLIERSNVEKNYQDELVRRERERKRLVKEGVIIGEDQAVKLKDAVDFHGVCTTFCSPFEIIKRVHQNAVDTCERDSEGRPDPQKFVKRFTRSAAGAEPDMPVDVRTPSTLVGTMKYLSELCNEGGISTTHSYIRDRTRAIRKDFTLQNYSGPEAVYCHELIARFHIVSLHLLASKTGFEESQEMEQLGKTLTSLAGFYNAKHREFSYYETEPEFRAYSIIMNHADADMDAAVSRLPRVIREHPLVQMAMHIRQLIESNTMPSRFGSAPEMTQSNEVALFSFVRNDEVPPLLRCMVSCRFQDMRRRALTKLCHHYPANSKALTLTYLRELLMYPDEESLMKELDWYQWKMGSDEGTSYIIPDKTFWPQDTPDTRRTLFHPGLLNPLDPSQPGSLWYISSSVPTFNNLDPDSTQEYPKQPYVPKILLEQQGKQDPMAHLLPPGLRKNLQAQLASVKVSDNMRMITQAKPSIPTNNTSKPAKLLSSVLNGSPMSTSGQSTTTAATKTPVHNPFAQVVPNRSPGIVNPFATIQQPAPSPPGNNPFANIPQQVPGEGNSMSDGRPPSSAPVPSSGFTNPSGFQIFAPTSAQHSPTQAFPTNPPPSTLFPQPGQAGPKPLNQSSKSMLFNSPGSATFNTPSLNQTEQKTSSSSNIFQPSSTESANDFFSKACEKEAREKAKASLSHLKPKTPPLSETPAATNNTPTTGGMFSSIPSLDAAQAPRIFSSAPTPNPPQTLSSAPTGTLFQTKPTAPATGFFTPNTQTPATNLFNPTAQHLPTAPASTNLFQSTIHPTSAASTSSGIFQPSGSSVSSLFSPAASSPPNLFPPSNTAANTSATNNALSKFPFNFQIDEKTVASSTAPTMSTLKEPIIDPDDVGKHPKQAYLDERARVRYLNIACYSRFVRWKESAMIRYNIHQRKLRQQQKEAKLKARKRQWLPCNVDPDVDDEHFADIKAAVFQAVNTPLWFYQALDALFDAAGIRNQTYQLWTRSDCPRTSYWWREKFLKGQEVLKRSLKNGNIFEARFCEQNTDISHVGALIYGCSADYSIPLEKRWDEDRRKLGDCIRRMVNESEYQAFSIMVVAYRAPLEHEGEVYRPPTNEPPEERAHRIKLIEEALGLHQLDHRVIYTSILLVDDEKHTTLNDAVGKLANSVRLRPDVSSRQNGQILTPETADESLVPISPQENNKRSRDLQLPHSGSISKRQCTPEKWSPSPEPYLRQRNSKGSLRPVRGGIGFLDKIKGGFGKKKKVTSKPTTPQAMSPDLAMRRTVSASSTDSITRKRRNEETPEESHHRRVGNILKKAKLGAGNTRIMDTPEKRAEKKAQSLGLKPLTFRSAPKKELTEQEKLEEVRRMKTKQHEETLQRSLIELEEIRAMGRSVSSFLGKGTL